MHTGSDVEDDPSTNNKEQTHLLTDSPPTDSDSDEVSLNVK